MHEGLNHWPFIWASYALGVLGTAGLIGSTWLAMRRAEARRERSRER